LNDWLGRAGSWEEEWITNNGSQGLTKRKTGMKLNPFAIMALVRNVKTVVRNIFKTGKRAIEEW